MFAGIFAPAAISPQPLLPHQVVDALKAKPYNQETANALSYLTCNHKAAVGVFLDQPVVVSVLLDIINDNVDAASNFIVIASKVLLFASSILVIDFEKPNQFTGLVNASMTDELRSAFLEPQSLQSFASFLLNPPSVSTPPSWENICGVLQNVFTVRLSANCLDFLDAGSASNGNSAEERELFNDMLPNAYYVASAFANPSLKLSEALFHCCRCNVVSVCEKALEVIEQFASTANVLIPFVVAGKIPHATSTANSNSITLKYVSILPELVKRLEEMSGITANFDSFNAYYARISDTTVQIKESMLIQEAILKTIGNIIEISKNETVVLQEMPQSPAASPSNSTEASHSRRRRSASAVASTTSAANSIEPSVQTESATRKTNASTSSVRKERSTVPQLSVTVDDDNTLLTVQSALQHQAYTCASEPPLSISKLLRVCSGYICRFAQNINTAVMSLYIVKILSRGTRSHRMAIFSQTAMLKSVVAIIQCNEEVFKQKPSKAEIISGSESSDPATVNTMTLYGVAGAADASPTVITASRKCAVAILHNLALELSIAEAMCNIISTNTNDNAAPATAACAASSVVANLASELRVMQALLRGILQEKNEAVMRDIWITMGHLVLQFPMNAVLLTGELVQEVVLQTLTKKNYIPLNSAQRGQKPRNVNGNASAGGDLGNNFQVDNVSVSPLSEVEQSQRIAIISQWEPYGCEVWALSLLSRICCAINTTPLTSVTAGAIASTLRLLRSPTMHDVLCQLANVTVLNPHMSSSGLPIAEANKINQRCVVSQLASISLAILYGNREVGACADMLIEEHRRSQSSFSRRGADICHWTTDVIHNVILTLYTRVKCIENVISARNSSAKKCEGLGAKETELNQLPPSLANLEYSLLSHTAMVKSYLGTPNLKSGVVVGIDSYMGFQESMFVTTLSTLCSNWRLNTECGLVANMMLLETFHMMLQRLLVQYCDDVDTDNAGSPSNGSNRLADKLFIWILTYQYWTDVGCIEQILSSLLHLYLSTYKQEVSSDIHNMWHCTIKGTVKELLLVALKNSRIPDYERKTLETALAKRDKTMLRASNFLFSSSLSSSSANASSSSAKSFASPHTTRISTGLGLGNCTSSIMDYLLLLYSLLEHGVDVDNAAAAAHGSDIGYMHMILNPPFNSVTGRNVQHLRGDGGSRSAIGETGCEVATIFIAHPPHHMLHSSCCSDLSKLDFGFRNKYKYNVVTSDKLWQRLTEIKNGIYTYPGVNLDYFDGWNRDGGEFSTEMKEIALYYHSKMVAGSIVHAVRNSSCVLQCVTAESKRHPYCRVLSNVIRAVAVRYQQEGSSQSSNPYYNQHRGRTGPNNGPTYFMNILLSKSFSRKSANKESLAALNQDMYCNRVIFANTALPKKAESAKSEQAATNSSIQNLFTNITATARGNSSGAAQESFQYAWFPMWVGADDIPAITAEVVTKCPLANSAPLMLEQHKHHFHRTFGPPNANNISAALASSLESNSVASTSSGSASSLLGDIDGDQLLQLIEHWLAPVIQSRQAALEAQEQSEVARKASAAQRERQERIKSMGSQNANGSWLSYVFGGAQGSTAGSETGSATAAGASETKPAPKSSAAPANGPVNESSTAVKAVKGPAVNASGGKRTGGVAPAAASSAAVAQSEQEKWKIAYDTLLNQHSHAQISYWTRDIRTVLSADLGVFSASDLAFCTPDQLRALSKYLKPIQRNKFLVHCNISGGDAPAMLKPKNVQTV